MNCGPLRKSAKSSSSSRPSPSRSSFFLRPLFRGRMERVALDIPSLSKFPHCSASHRYFSLRGKLYDVRERRLGVSIYRVLGPFAGSRAGYVTRIMWVIRFSGNQPRFFSFWERVPNPAAAPAFTREDPGEEEEALIHFRSHGDHGLSTF